MNVSQAPAFEEHFAQALEDLRGSLTELYLASGADPESPQEVSRQFGLHRNLCWKVTRVMRSQELGDLLPYLPGTAGIERLLQAFEAAGAAPSRLAAVQEAQLGFERMVELHAGDRATLEVMLDSLSSGEQRDSLETSRSLAFRGNSGIWGIQARTRLRTVFVAPNPERADLLDTAQITGLIDLRRFRRDATCPLFQRRHFNDDGSPRQVNSEPIDESLGEQDASMLLPEFCTTPLPEVRMVPTALGAHYELGGGPVGNRGRTTCVYGGLMRRFAPRYRDEQNTRGEFYADINAPAENLLFDLMVHEDLLDEMQIQAEVRHVVAARLEDQPPPALIPCSERVRRLESIPPRVTSPLVPRYEEIVQRVHERLGWDPAAFRAMRFEMKFPPLPSQVVLRYELPAAP